MTRILQTGLQAGVFTAALIVGVIDTAHAACADYNNDGRITAADALGIIQVATGQGSCDVYRCDVDGSGSISATDALGALKLAVGQSVTMQCPDDPSVCLNDMEFFFENIWTPIQTDCITCHVAGGLAGHTRHVLKPSSEDGYLDHNFNTWKLLSELPDDPPLLLTKPLGIDHAGGQRLGITPTSIHYLNILELLDRFENPITNCGGSEDFWASVDYLSDLETLDKAAMIFAARRPTQGEIDAVIAEGDAGLRRIIRKLMVDEAFEQFVIEAANDRLLTDKYLIKQSNSFSVLKGEYEYPDLYKRISQVRAIYGEETANDVWYRTNAALAREPLQLFVNIAKYEKPYTEIVTADYLMVNPFSAPVYRTKSDIHTSWDDDHWRAGHNNGYRIAGYPHAGILTSPMFLSRFPSTATNRNRARARWISAFFLGQDIEKLAPRTVDPAALDEADNPTMYNPACTVCHSVMDPIAGTLQDFGDDGLYLQFETDSLPWSYKQTDLYHHGDRWYRDMRAPGFNGTAMPASESDRAIQWLGQQIAADPRFPRGAVEFWYQGLFGRPPLLRPTDPTQSEYRGLLNAWVAQDELFSDVAARFRDGTAGTGRNGAFNLKDLLVELAVSPWFRARSAPAPSTQRDAELADVGLVKLLTPEQLNRKFESLTDAVWAKSWDTDHPYLLDRYRLFYGGIDSSGITTRASELNALMSTVPQRLANEMACPLAVSDFSRSAGARKLFPLVDPDDLPGTPAGEAAIRANLVWLHYWLLGEVLAEDDPQIELVFALFTDIYDLRHSQQKSTNLRWGGGHCELDFSSGSYVDQDPNHTIRAWITVLAYLFSDFRFIYA